MRQQWLHIPVMWHSIHIPISACNSHFMWNCFSLLKGTIVSQVPQDLVETLRHVHTVDSHMASAFKYDNNGLPSST